jgi:hypothetical protein
MNQTIHLDPKQVPAQLKVGYDGRKFKAIVCESVTIPMTAGLWFGGSRDTYRVVQMADGADMPASDDMSSPWDANRKERKVTLQPGFCVIEHSIFCGKDAGLTIYICASDAAPMLPVADELSEAELWALNATDYKSSYNGMNRYQNAARDSKNLGKFTPSLVEYEAAKASLMTRGYMNKAGAITVAGKNARKR